MDGLDLIRSQVEPHAGAGAVTEMLSAQNKLPGDTEPECAADVPPLPFVSIVSPWEMADVIIACVNAKGCVELADFRATGFDEIDVARMGERARDAAILSGKLQAPIRIEWPVGWSE